MDAIHYLDPNNPVFPNPRRASDELGGLLAAGGNLESATLVKAYSSGIFPWYEEDQPILWWSPPTRAVMFPGGIHVSRSLKKAIKRENWTVSSDARFAEVVEYCAATRENASGTWITPDMKAAYNQLHREGHAHSVEVWKDEALVGGLYGVAVGGMFCGESMFSLAANASKIALVCLSATLFNRGFELIDCQLENDHLTSMGATLLSRDDFLNRLAICRQKSCHWPSNWILARL